MSVEQLDKPAKHTFYLDPSRIPEEQRINGEGHFVYETESRIVQVVNVTLYHGPGGKVTGETRTVRAAGAADDLNPKNKLPEPGTGFGWGKLMEAWNNAHTPGHRDYYPNRMPVGVVWIVRD
jgi:hypothetical protein